MDERFDEKFRALAAERDALRIEVAELRRSIADLNAARANFRDAVEARRKAEQALLDHYRALATERGRTFWLN
jgi:prefoldin subunit 5